MSGPLVTAAVGASRRRSDLIPPKQRRGPTLERVAFKTDRLGEFVGRRELTAQIGHPPKEWPLVLLKEAVDNALDACEEALGPPEIHIDVSTDSGSITVTDNGPGIAPQTIHDILDYTARVSSREAYVSPARGAQGNALKTVLAMPYDPDGNSGTSVIESRGVRHEITFCVDQLRQRPVIDHQQTHGLLQKGTRLRVDLAYAQACSTRNRVFYKSRTTSPGSTRIWASRSSGTGSRGSVVSHRIRHGRSGGRPIRPQLTGMTSRGLPVTSRRMSRAIRIVAATARSANSSLRCEGSPVRQSRSKSSIRPGSVGRRCHRCLALTAPPKTPPSQHCSMR